MCHVLPPSTLGSSLVLSYSFLSPGPSSSSCSLSLPWREVCSLLSGKWRARQGYVRLLVVQAGQRTCFPGAGDPHPLGVKVDWNELQILLRFAAAGLKRRP